MHIDQRKEQFGHAYVRAVASVAGFGASRPEVDDDSVDLSLSDRGAGGTTRSPRLELQLKSTSRIDLLHEDHIAFPLPVKNYDDLRPDNLLVPRILVVVFLPEDLDHWIVHTEDQMALRRCGYWASLRGREAVDNVASVTIHVMRANVFNVPALQQMMTNIEAGVAP